MRAAVPGLISPHPLGFALPGVYHDDPVIQSFLSAFDEVLAPIFSTLDNLDAYFDPRLTPPDFLEWLGGWVGMVLDEHWPLERRRKLVQAAVELYRWRGTVRGLAAHVALHTGVEPDIEESGGLVWSSRPGQAVPGTADSFVRVRVRVPDPSAINAERLSAMIGASLPADIIHELIVEQAIEPVDELDGEPVDAAAAEMVEVVTPVTAEPDVAVEPPPMQPEAPAPEADAAPVEPAAESPVEPGEEQGGEQAGDEA